jgi:rhodanese-related sulfurtransferase
MEAIIESKDAILLDVNGSKYFAKGHLPGAIDFRENEESLPTILGEDKEKLIVVYCGSPSCEAYLAAAVAVQQLGYTNVKHLPAGISGWITAGKPTEVSKE